MAEAHAPYNFVPFSNKIIKYPYPEMPGHDKVNPELRTGEIHYTLTAETPVLVSDGKGDNNEKHFCKTPDGKYVIPGSTLRGAIRENMQILSFGLVRPNEDVQDYNLFYRDMASSTDSAGKALKEYYTNVLQVKSYRTQRGNNISKPENVKAGYISNNNGEYSIRPVVGDYLRISRNHPSIKDKIHENAKVIPAFYRTRGNQIEELNFSADINAGWECGNLLFTGKPVGKTPNSAYIFPQEDTTANSIKIESDDIVSYKEDLEKRKNSLKGAKYNPDFWKLPENGDSKPVFYVEQDGHIYFGMTLFLRIGYKHSIAEGLPEKQIKQFEEYPDFMDYPHAILGYAKNKKAFQSRVSFEDAFAEKSPKETDGIKVVLGEPKPSFYPGYVEGGKNYNDDDFRLRGYKQYWLKEQTQAAAGKDNVTTTLFPLPKDTKFTGVIRYKNLHEDELGLLLWALKLEEGCYHSLGMGKPYGYGRMKLTSIELKQFDLDSLYTPQGFVNTPQTSGKDEIENLINTFVNEAEAALFKGKKGKKATLKETDELSAFFFMRSEIREGKDVSYMDLDAREYQNLGGPLKPVKEIKKDLEAQKNKKAEPEQETDMFEALRKRFGGI